MPPGTFEDVAFSRTRPNLVTRIGGKLGQSYFITQVIKHTLTPLAACDLPPWYRSRLHPVCCTLQAAKMEDDRLAYIASTASKRTRVSLNGVASAATQRNIDIVADEGTPVFLSSGHKGSDGYVDVEQSLLHHIDPKLRPNTMIKRHNPAVHCCSDGTTSVHTVQSSHV